MDWSDGAHVLLTGDDRKLINEIFQQFFVEVGAAESEYNEAMEDFEDWDDEEEE